ncbi:nicotinate-nucleotide--dimethylbenzimidazole phosphoribosyltransferase [uncultured Megasphaera sp.]|uniref:nicotinate-nucleotide--dimethylbenzimidazole phosphoribosyltransferase n=1 Tax=uncultured Megasphaera sp. TaxID=165188 RepID=UPI002597EE38|nr:nicotinate-nucleotide--dimethylbenzimidazole phosphoribosyltransferase [uncultured Megasphaera sp.]
MDEELQQFISLIEGADVLVQEQCRQRLAASGTADATVSHVAERIAGVAGTLQPEPLKKAVVLFAADHAVDGGKNESKGKNSKADALEIAGGKGAINKVAHRVNAGVLLLDLGLEEDIPESMGVQDLKVMHGSHYYGNGPAMTEDEMLDAFYSGIQIAQNLADEGYTAIGLGNLGERALLTGFIVTAAFYRQKLAGLQGTLQERNQVKMLSAMLRTHGLDAAQPMELLQKAGSPDIAAMTGFILSAAQRRMLVVFDNGVTGAAVLLAHALQEKVTDFVFPSAAYNEPVHQMQMTYLQMHPLLTGAGKDDQGMGSVLGLSLLDAAVQLMHDKL